MRRVSDDGADDGVVSLSQMLAEWDRELNEPWDPGKVFAAREAEYRRGYRDGFQVALEALMDFMVDHELPRRQAYLRLFDFANHGVLAEWYLQAQHAKVADLVHPPRATLESAPATDPESRGEDGY